jgi:hypothetical protein
MDKPSERLSRELKLLARLDALISTLDTARVNQALSEAGHTVWTLSALRKQVHAELAEHDTWHELTELLNAERRALFAERVTALGLDPAKLDVDRDWSTVWQYDQRVEEGRIFAAKVQAEMRGPPVAKSIAELRKHIEALLEASSDANREKLIKEAGLVWIDWRDAPADVVEAFAPLCKEPKLGARGENPVVLTCGRRKVSLKLTETQTDFSAVIHALNGVIRPDYELRLARGSSGETLPFALLHRSDWAELTARYPELLPELFAPLVDGQDLLG